MANFMGHTTQFNLDQIRLIEHLGDTIKVTWTNSDVQVLKKDSDGYSELAGFEGCPHGPVIPAAAGERALVIYHGDPEEVPVIGWQLFRDDNEVTCKPILIESASGNGVVLTRFPNGKVYCYNTDATYDDLEDAIKHFTKVDK